MAGIYIHIPFCKKACNYCDFHFSTQVRHKEKFLEALVMEIEARKNYLDGEAITTVYFGGGTPSLLTGKEIDKIFSKLESVFDLSPLAEVTLEVNPDDITGEKIHEIRNTRVNRLSIGIQSFFNEHLQWMNRAHSAADALRAIELAASVFSNYTIDLIYGFPSLSDEQWEENLQMALSYKPPHLSAYCMTVEDGTLLSNRIRKNADREMIPEQAIRHFDSLLYNLTGNGYEQYEISNFSRSGFRAMHNSSYWKHLPYLGLGPSAHSFNNGKRQWNISNNAGYIKSLSDGTYSPAGFEELTTTNLLNETILLSLRTTEGISGSNISARFGSLALQSLTDKATKFRKLGLLEVTHEKIALTHAGKLQADYIASELFYP